MKMIDRRGKRFARIVGITVFLILGIIIFSRVSEVLRKKTGNSTDMIHSFYDLDRNSLDVLVLGSSHGFCSFQPNLLWDKYGITSYVMCSQRQTVAQSYYLLREALKYQTPRVVVLEAYYFFFTGEHTGEMALRYAYDGMRFSRLKYEMIEDFREGMSWEDKMTYYIPFIKYHSRWNELKDSDFNRSLWMKGAVFSDSTTAVAEPVLPTEGSGIPAVFQDYFERIEAICRENNIELMVYAAPYTYLSDKEKDREDFERKYKTYIALEPYFEEKGIPFLFFQKNGGLDIDYSQDFQDYSHMNIFGAVKVTRALGTYLHDNYDLPDHRKEKAYQSWKRDCRIFRKKVKKLGIPV